MDLVIGCVGKPSVGKSTFFNAVTEGKAKMGNFPFTTIEPNTGVTYYKCECACKSRDKVAECSPRYGRCDKGIRHIPVRLLDVAGLVPGASQGAGLGNKFLDDLRAADVLIHIIDVSGTTNEKGEVTEGYDPINDAEWLDSEVHAWVFNNLWGKWPNIVRRHTATKSNICTTLVAQFSGYGANSSLVNLVLDKLGISDPLNLTEWGDEEVHRLVNAFLEVRFPTILFLNKADQGGNTDQNILNVVNKYGGERCVVGSSACELFLKNCSKKNFISYSGGDSTFMSKADWDDEVEFRRMRGEEIKEDEIAVYASLIEPPEVKVTRRLERIKDMVLYRFGSTGTWQCIQAAVNLKNPVIAYPVRSFRSYITDPDQEGGAVFAECYLLKAGSTVRQLAHKKFSDSSAQFQAADGEDGRRLADDHEITGLQFVVKFSLKKDEIAEAKLEEARSHTRAKPVTRVEKKDEQKPV